MDCETDRKKWENKTGWWALIETSGIIYFGSGVCGEM